MEINTEKSKVNIYNNVFLYFVEEGVIITTDMYIKEFNNNEPIKFYSYTHRYCKLKCLDIENRTIRFTTILNETLIIENIKELNINDELININDDKKEQLNVKNC